MVGRVFLALNGPVLGILGVRGYLQRTSFDRVQLCDDQQNENILGELSLGKEQEPILSSHRRRNRSLHRYHADISDSEVEAYGLYAYLPSRQRHTPRRPLFRARRKWRR